ncbi:MAG: cysteine--tRNA ligase, partial [Tabrizicola sp.]|nr:cysteine--tRNA ligase [Tabrizicola sp.]
KKMSKSLGNFFTVRDLLDQGIPGEVIRFVFLMTHYRSPMDWTEKKRREAEATLRKVTEFLAAHPFTKPRSDLRYAKAPEEFVEALANDLNTSLALTLVSRYLRNRDEFSLVGALRLLGFDHQALIAKFAPFSVRSYDNGIVSGHTIVARSAQAMSEAQRVSELRERLDTLRTVAMASKDFSAVDALKSALIAAGVEVRMSKAGVELVPGPDFDPAKLEALQ